MASSSCRSRPQRVAVVGSSYIAVELAGILRGLGSDTTLVLRGESVLRSFEPMLGEAALVSLRDDGVDVVMQASPERARARRAGPARAARGATGAGSGPSTPWCGPSAACRRSRISRCRRPAWRSASDGFIAHRCLPGRPACRASMPSATSPDACSSRRSRSPPGRRLADRLFGGQTDRHLDYENHPDGDLRPPADRHRGTDRARGARTLRDRERHGVPLQLRAPLPRAHHGARRAWR